MAKLRNHTNKHNTYKIHRNGIFKPHKHKYSSMKGMDQKFVKNQRYAKRHAPSKKQQRARAKGQADIAENHELNTFQHLLEIDSVLHFHLPFMAVARTKALCSQLTDPERNKGNAPSADELQELVNTLQSDEESLKHTRAALLELRKNLAARKGRRTMLALQSLQHLAQHSSMTVRAQMVELKVLNAVAKLCSSNTGPLGTKPSPDIVDKAKELIIEWSHFPQPQFERMLQELQSKGVRFPDSMDENHDEHYQSEYELSEEDRNAIEQAIREDEHLQRQQQREISQQQQQPVVTATAAAAAFPSQDASIATADQFLTGTRSKAGLHEDISTAMDTIALLYDQMREGANSGSIDEDTLVAVQQQVQVIQQRAAKLVQAIDDEALLSTLLDVNDQSEKALSTYSMWRSGQSVPELQPEHSDAFPAQNAPAKMDDFDLLMAPAESTAGIGSNQQQAGAHQQQNWSHSDPLQELLASSNMSHGKGKAQAPNHPQSYSSDPFESLSTTPPSTQPSSQKPTTSGVQHEQHESIERKSAPQNAGQGMTTAPPAPANTRARNNIDPFADLEVDRR